MNQLSAIQSIIVGPALAEMKAHLQQLHQQLAQHQADTSNQLAQLEQRMQDTAAVLRREQEAQTARLDQQKTDREQLGRLLIQLGEQLIRG